MFLLSTTSIAPLSIFKTSSLYIITHVYNIQYHPGSFHWDLHFHGDAKSGGKKHYISSPDNGWITERAQVVSIGKEIGLIGLFPIWGYQLRSQDGGHAYPGGGREAKRYKTEIL